VVRHLDHCRLGLGYFPPKIFFKGHDRPRPIFYGRFRVLVRLRPFPDLHCNTRSATSQFSGFFITHSSSSLQGVKSNDAGEYECIAKNKFGQISAKGYVIVKRKYQEVDVTGGCVELILWFGSHARTDFVHSAHLHDEWKMHSSSIFQDFENSQHKI
jgi:hypothetical protein